MAVAELAGSERTAPVDRSIRCWHWESGTAKKGTTAIRKILELPCILLRTGKLHSIRWRVEWWRDSRCEAKGRNVMWKTSENDDPNMENWDALPKAEATLTTPGGKSVLIIKSCSAPPSCPSSWHIVWKTMSNPVGTTPNHHHTGHQCQHNAELAVEKLSQKRSKELPNGGQAFGSPNPAPVVRSKVLSVFQSEEQGLRRLPVAPYDWKGLEKGVLTCM